MTTEKTSGIRGGGWREIIGMVKEDVMNTINRTDPKHQWICVETWIPTSCDKAVMVLACTQCLKLIE